MRVISGTARGCRLKTAEGEHTRPTIERVKEAIFSSLQERLRGAVVLDLFAGSGQLGIEALSRGAAHTYFCDNDRTASSVIAANLEKARVKDRATFFAGDFRRVCAALPQAVNLVFLDPPFADGLWEEAMSLLLSGGKLAPDAVVVTESDGHHPAPAEVAGFTLFKEAHYGNIIIRYFRFDGEVSA